MTKSSFFSYVVSVLALIIALFNPESKAMIMVFFQYGWAIIVMVAILYTKRKNVNKWLAAGTMAVYAVPAVVMLIKRAEILPINGVVERITIGMMAVLMLMSGFIKCGMEENAS